MDDPSLFEFNEAMKDQKDPDDIEAGPVPYDYSMQYSAEESSHLTFDAETLFGKTQSELD